MSTDLRYALRTLLKTPGVSIAAVVSLALGIGANATIFTWVKAVLLEPLPGVSRQGDIVVVANQTKDGDYVSMSYPDYRDYRDKSKTLDGLVVTEMATLSLGAVSAGQRAERLYGALADRVAALPRVTSAALARRVPLGFTGSSSTKIAIDGYVPDPNESMQVNFNMVGPDYFRTMQMPLLSGREFTVRDDEKSPPVVIVNAAMARRYWQRTDVVGRRIRVGGENWEVVGVVPTGKYQTLGEPARSYMFVPLAQMYRPDAVLHVRTAGDPAAVAAAVRDVVAGLDPNLPLFDVKTLRSHMGFATMTPRIAASLLGAFGVLALVLAAVGLNSVIAYSVSQRTREVAIRMALGARPADVRALIIRQGMGLLAIGLVVGVAIAYGALPFMSSLLIGISGRDPLTLRQWARSSGASRSSRATSRPDGPRAWIRLAH